ncbi:MAG: hypothetical protein ABI054_11970 [Planctomycetota bacterium]
MKIALITCALIAPLFPALVRQQACPNVIAHEPVVLFEVAGSTIAARVDRTLTVYADGSMLMSEAGTAGSRGHCMRVQTTPGVVADLKLALIKAGAQTLCDHQIQVTDVPLRTLTMMGGSQDSRAHTFSYWTPEPEYAAVDAELETFIAEQFPGF